MSIVYPDKWAVLSYPNIRSDLLLFLKELSDIRFQVNSLNSSSTGHDQFDIDEIYHFFFDDTDLVVNPEAYIGEIFFDIDEVKIISQVTSALKNILDELGDSSNDKFISHPYWGHVVDNASFALKKLSESGIPQIA